MTTQDTPNRSSRSQRRPANREALDELLRELDISPPGPARYRLVSRWAAKHVWEVNVGGRPWAYIRYLLGPAGRFPHRWRHMRLGVLLNEARVGPRILGMTPESEALGGRAAIVEAALEPITREELEGRAVEVIALFTRLHTSPALLEALSQDVTDTDRALFSPLRELFEEVHERWFEAVRERWLAAGLSEIKEALWIVGELLERLRTLPLDTTRMEIVVPAHNDPNHGNFMVNRRGALRMIDFENLALNNPVADLGLFLTWYVDRDRHRELLEHYPLAEPDAVLERMRIWVPLRYLGIAAHWAARLTRARTPETWEFAASSVEEWLRGAAELIFEGDVPPHLDRLLPGLRAALLARYPLHEPPA